MHQYLIVNERDMSPFCFLLIYLASTCYLNCYGQIVTNVVPGVYSTKRESDGLYLASSSSYMPIEALTSLIHLHTSAAVFVHYQITLQSSKQDLYSKLLISNDQTGEIKNAGALVHSRSYQYQGYWMANLEAGYYKFEVHYQSHNVGIDKLEINAGFQTAVINIMWFVSGHAVSDGIKCHPSSRIAYPQPENILSPIKNLGALLMSNNRAVIGAYQLSLHSTSSSAWFTTRLYVNNQQQESTISTSGYTRKLHTNSLWFKNLRSGSYYFGLTYRTTYDTYFEDCVQDNEGNQNLFAMTLPSICSVIANINPAPKTYTFSTTSWQNTDLSYTFTMTRVRHVLIRYQYTTNVRHHTYVTTRLTVQLPGSIDFVLLNHTRSINGGDGFASNSGMWQGPLPTGTHTVTVQHNSNKTYTHYPSEFCVRTMDILVC